MNVRDFLYNFVDRNAKISIKNTVNEKVPYLFYGKARDIDDIDLLNKIVEMVEYDSHADCLTIVVSLCSTGATYHLPEDTDSVY